MEFQIQEAKDAIALKKAKSTGPDDIKVGVCTELMVSFGYIIVTGLGSLFATHGFFAFFYAVEDIDDSDEASLVSQLTVVYYIIIVIIVVISISFNLLRRRKLCLMVGITICMVTTLALSACYYVGTWVVPKGLIFFILYACVGLNGPCLFSLLAETLSSHIMVFSYALLNLFFFTANSIFPIVLKKTNDGVYYMYGFLFTASMAFVSLFIIYLFFAETGGKSKKEIYDRLLWKKSAKILGNKIGVKEITGVELEGNEKSRE